MAVERDVLVVRGRRDTLRAESVHIFELDPGPDGGYFFIGRGRDRCWPEGEVQVFGNYRRRVVSAQLARRELEAAGDVDESHIWPRNTEIRHRQNVARAQAARRR